MDNDQQLSIVLAEFARELTSDITTQGILDYMVARIVEVLPISAAGVTLMAGGNGNDYTAASDDAAWGFEQLQHDLTEGPCQTACESGETVVVTDLKVDQRFPAFRAKAIGAGMRSVIAIPLQVGDHRLGALNLYRTAVGPMSEDELQRATTLADVTAAYLINAQARLDLRRSSDTARHVALHDPLTGLPNRVLLLERLNHAIARCQRSGSLVAVLYADLDKFKWINDNYGHQVGDEVLVNVANALTKMMRPGDTVARMAGDEFVILCEDLDKEAQSMSIAARACDVLSEPFNVNGTKVKLSVSIGIALAHRGSENSEQILQEADTAMYQAKRRGGARYDMVDLTEMNDARLQNTMDADLREALGRGELRLEYQPILSAEGGIHSVEALLRWDHPSHGTMGPDIAIPVAEKSGLIDDIGGWIVQRACLDLKRLQRSPKASTLGISVNLSARQLRAPLFVPTVAAMLNHTATDPSLLTLEITENVLVHDIEGIVFVVEGLRRLGVQVALDDFGTGYSSLTQMQQVPFDVVKIDRSIISGLNHTQSNQVLVQAAVAMAHGLGMAIVAEGIETPAERELAISLGCDRLQGYFFAHPTSVEGLGALLELK